MLHSGIVAQCMVEMQSAYMLLDNSDSDNEYNDDDNDYQESDEDGDDYNHRPCSKICLPQLQKQFEMREDSNCNDTNVNLECRSDQDSNVETVFSIKVHNYPDLLTTMNRKNNQDDILRHSQPQNLQEYASFGLTSSKGSGEARYSSLPVFEAAEVLSRPENGS